MRKFLYLLAIICSCLLSPIDLFAQTNSSVKLQGEWVGYAQSGATQLDYRWEIEQSGSSLSGKISIKFQDDVGWSTFRMQGNVLEGVVTFAGTKWLQTNNNNFCLAAGSLQVTADAGKAILEGQWGPNAVQGGCPDGYTGQVRLTRMESVSMAEVASPSTPQMDAIPSVDPSDTEDACRDGTMSDLPCDIIAELTRKMHDPDNLLSAEAARKLVSIVEEKQLATRRPQVAINAYSMLGVHSGDTDPSIETAIDIILSDSTTGPARFVIPARAERYAASASNIARKYWLAGNMDTAFSISMRFLDKNASPDELSVDSFFALIQNMASKGHADSAFIAFELAANERDKNKFLFAAANNGHPSAMATLGLELIDGSVSDGMHRVIGIGAGEFQALGMTFLENARKAGEPLAVKRLAEIEAEQKRIAEAREEELERQREIQREKTAAARAARKLDPPKAPTTKDTKKIDLASQVDATDPNWLYLTNRDDIVKTFQQPPYPTGGRFCVIEGWTPENSGVYELAKGWKGMILPNAPSNPNALSLILSTIDLASDGECDFVAVPWYVPQFRKPISDRIEANGVVEITGLSALQVGSSHSVSSGNEAIVSVELDSSDSTGSGAKPTWRYFAYEHLIRVDPSLFDPLGGMHGRKVCSFGSLTILNSGFPRVAPNWYIFPYAAAKSKQEATAVTQEVMKDSARSTCLIVAVPRDDYAQLDIVLGELKKNNMIEIPSMSNPEPPTASVALQQNAPEQTTELLEMAESVAKEVQKLCSNDPRLNIDFDCECVAENIQVGISTGELSQIVDSNYHFNKLLKSGDANCVNDNAIRKDIIKNCPNLMVFTFQDPNMDCECLADYAIARFRENPIPRTRDKILLSRPADAQRCTKQ